MRESGYYWVKSKDGNWFVGNWLLGKWYIGVLNFSMDESFFAEIGQRIPDNETLKKLNHEHTT